MKLADPVKNCKWAKYPLGDISQWFNENPELYQKYTKLVAHNGIDIVRPYGEHLFAVEDGVVTDVKDTADGYGKHIRITTAPDSSGEAREWTYAHLSYIHVKEGETVNRGDYVANMGNTGFVVSNGTANGYWSSNPYRGTHLHLGVRNRKNGRVVDYGNGYFGSYDPLPLFRDPSLLSSKIISMASDLQDSVLFAFGQLLRKIDM